MSEATPATLADLMKLSQEADAAEAKSILAGKELKQAENRLKKKQEEAATLRAKVNEMKAAFEGLLAKPAPKK